MQMSRQDAEDFMQQEDCPALPDDVLEWQTPHLARAPEEGDAGDTPSPPLARPPAASLTASPHTLLMPFLPDVHLCPF